ncbi:MAG: hypothetical protein KME57_00720 [Scytonema hyalinum WJT4-NPBG1]|jgi:hemoglobin-like flavoprotein|nr:hypothetical protein [Scytonema hyalinum WJT4-NPBG1]
MSSLNVKVLEKSFAGIKPYATQFASRFYYNLFTDNPQLEPLFANTNMQEQDKKLYQIRLNAHSKAATCLRPPMVTS